MLLQEFLRLSHQFERRLGEELNVNATDYRAMEHLLRAGPLPSGELARRLEITGAAATTVVDRLIQRGHVRRQPDPSDRRRVLVAPTTSSAADADRLIMPMVTAIDTQLAAFTPSEQRAITAYLHGIVDITRKHAELPAPDTAHD